MIFLKAANKVSVIFAANPQKKKSEINSVSANAFLFIIKNILCITQNRHKVSGSLLKEKNHYLIDDTKLNKAFLSIILLTLHQ